MKNLNLAVLLSIMLFQFNVLASNSINASSVVWDGYFANVSLLKSSHYQFKTNFPLKDDIPVSSQRLIPIDYQKLNIVSGSNIFDGVFALSLEEVRQNKVNYIEDYSFSKVPCECFETGKKWKYVWTRDTAYSVDLSLSYIDPIRSLNSLNFKTSQKRVSLIKNNLNYLSGPEIIQDTGSGGSWPISTDRVVWSLGALKLYYSLPNESLKTEFLNHAITVLENTIENDRTAIFDQNDGLYLGEQSFLDWREQTYPKWVQSNVIHVGMSKSLSTNLLHYKALMVLSKFLNIKKEYKKSKKYLNWALLLKKEINKNFWDEDQKLYKMYISTFLDRHLVNKYDLLSNALAAIFEIGETESQQNNLKNYPLVNAGASVVWPQDQDVPIYHNRAIWPFVTAYALLGAKKQKQYKLFDHLFNSLIRGTVLNLSNMENFEFLTMKNWLWDGPKSGPVVNSQRQLWSVAGMISAQINGILGIELYEDHLKIDPTLTSEFIANILQSDFIHLNNFKAHNKILNIKFNLNTINKIYDNRYSIFVVDTIKLNGNELGNINKIYYEDLLNSNNIEINLKRVVKTKVDSTKILNLTYNKVSQLDFEKIYAPKTPFLNPIELKNGFPLLNFQNFSDADSYFKIYKNGKLLKDKYKYTEFIDYHHNLLETACYSVEQIYESSKNHSYPSEPFCYWPNNAIQVFNLNSRSKQISLGLDNKNKYSSSFTALKSGTYALQVSYNNIGPISTGVTCGVKLAKVYSKKTNDLVLESVLVMPHHDHNKYWIDSNFLTLNLVKDEEYILFIEDFYNMSYFSHFSNYLEKGGKDGVYNQVNISSIKLLHLQ